MSTRGELLYQPINGTVEKTWNGFSWPAFFFGIIWLLIKGLYGHFLINLVLLFVTMGFAAPVIWTVYGFIGNGAHKSSLLKKGYLTYDQWTAKNQPAQIIQTAPAPIASPAQSSPFAQLRELADLRDRGVLTEEEFGAQKRKLLGM